MNARLQKLLRKVLVDWSLPITIFLLVLSVGGVVLSHNLELKLSLTDLLPQDSPAVVKFNKLTDIVGGVGYLTAILHAEDGESHLKIAPKVIEELKKDKLVRTAFFAREQRFFLDRLLYYADTPKLIELEANIQKQVIKAKRQMFDLGLFDDDGKPKEVEKPAFDDQLTQQAQKAAKISPYLTTKDGKYLLVMVKPSFDSLDFGRTKDLLASTEATLKKVLPANVTYSFSGRYYSKVVESKMIEDDIYILGFLSNIVMAIIIFLYFRSLKAVVLVFVPIFMGLGITAGLTKLVIGHINIITGFLVGIISGVATDYGIHMYWRMRLEKQSPSSSDPDPLWRTVLTTGWANFIVVAASCLSFFILCVSSFKVFSELGFICGVGLAVILITMLCTFHALGKLLNIENSVGNYKPPFGKLQLPVLRSRKSFVISLIVTFVVLGLGSRVKFEFDFDKMMKHSEEMRRMDKLVDDVYDRSTTPSAFASQSKEEALAVEAMVKVKYMPKIVGDMVSGVSMIPPEQVEKQRILLRIKELIRPIRDKWMERSIGIPAVAIHKWVEAKPFAFEDLPSHVADALHGTSQTGYLIYLYPAMNLNTGENVQIWADTVRSIERQFPNLVTGSDAVIFSDILDLIKHDGILLMSLIFISVGLFLWLIVKDLKFASLSYFTFMLALPVGVGLMAIFGVKFNIFNTAVIPAFIAIGIEIPVNIMQRTKEIGSGFQATRDVAVSNQLSLLTTMVGFGVLVFTRAGVLQSLGWISIMMTLAVWWVGIFILPAFLERFYHLRTTREPHRSLH